MLIDVEGCLNCSTNLVPPKPDTGGGRVEPSSNDGEPVEAPEHRRYAPDTRYLPGLSPWL